MKSILKRLLFTYLGIFLLTFVVMVLILTQYLNSYYLGVKQDQLLEQGRNVRDRIVEYQKGQIGQDQLDQYVNAVSDAAGVRIVALNLKTDADKKMVYEQITKKFGRNGFYDLKSVQEGKTICRKRQFGTDRNMEVVLVGLPIFSSAKQVDGAVLLLSPLDGVRETVSYVTRIVWGIAVIFMLVAAFLIYGTARRISAPITAVSEAAVRIAEGEEEPDIVVRGNDEVSHLAESFNYMKNRLRQVEEMRQDLISNVSHELRTPLTTMGGFVQAMLDGKIKPEEQNHYLQLVRLETKRLARLVNDILLTAQVQSGNLELLKISVDVPEVVDEVIQSLSLEAADHGIQLINHNDSALPEVKADRDRVKQIVMNILGNALQHTPDGGTITVSYVADDMYINTSISDTGTGVAEDKIELIFEKFYRADASRSPSGSGLGLSIVRHLVELHNGRITASNNADQGITVTFSLPREKRI